MIERTFPLHALPAFEAASRHGSFKAAAGELHLTASAISHQIKQLEGALGVMLFRRLPRGLELTVAGVRYAEVVGDLLEHLAREGNAIAGRAPRKQVRFNMPHFVAQACAIPNLSHFQTSHPYIELSITTGMTLVDLEGGEADAAIRMGPGSWRGVAAAKITDCYGTVVATAELAARARALSDRGELPVVCLSSLREHTRGMLEACAGLEAGPNHMVFLDSYTGVIQAARQGTGVAVAFTPTGDPLRVGGDLVSLAEAPVKVPFGMYFACRMADADRPEIAAVREWAQAWFGRHAWLLSATAGASG